VVVDAAGDVGRFPRIRVDPNGRPHIVYTLSDSIEDGHVGIRYAVGTEAARSADNFRVRDVWVRRQPEPEAGRDRPDAELHHPRACMRLLSEGTLAIGLRDPNGGQMHVARGGINGFVIEPLSGVFEGDDPGERYRSIAEHPMGRFCDVVKEGDGIHLLAPDEQTGALLAYQGPLEGPGTLRLVDDGTPGERQLIGADPAIFQSNGGRLFAVYQDGTNNDLRLNSYTPGSGWGQPRTIAADGALGFANSLVVDGDEIIIGTVELRTTAGGRDNSRARVFRIPLN
jgi:hypothetical protein